MDLRFQTFGQWLVLGKATGKGKEQFWVCQCSCNAMAEIHQDALLEGRARDCGCQGAQNFKDVTGQRFGSWLVLFLSPRHRCSGKAYWVCQCVCGTRREILGDHLRSGRTTSCSCLRTKVVRHRWYGRLFTLRREDPQPGRRGSILWHCQCMCGATCTVPSHRLTSGETRSCGCLTRRGKDLHGQVFGRLTVLGLAGKAQDGSLLWHCKCTCGTTCTVQRVCLTQGRTRSCGCLRREVAAVCLLQGRRKRHKRPLSLTFSCPRCLTVYPRTSEFFYRHGRRGGKEQLEAYCKPCVRRMDAARYARRKARLEALAAP
jgi:hypothetical protein